MARLRTLLVTDPDGPRDVLVLDDLTPEQVDMMRGYTAPDSAPFILALEFPVDLPEPDDGTRVTLDVPGDDEELKKTIRRHAAR